jgi:hypothetical protein
MVLLCGIPTESPLLLVRDRLDAMGTPYLVLSQRRFAGLPFWFRIGDGCVTGEVVIDGRAHALEDIFGVYTRLMDFRSLPELAGEPEGSARRVLARDWHDAVSRWFEVTPARVVNRAAPMGSNASKPFQAQAVTRRGFFTPETLVTNDPDLARTFMNEHERVVYKSISGVRSIVREIDADALAHCVSTAIRPQALLPGRPASRAATSRCSMKCMSWIRSR